MSAASGETGQGWRRTHPQVLALELGGDGLQAGLDPPNSGLLPDAAQWLRMSLLKPVALIRTAIEEMRMLRLMYHDKERILEPHDYGILNGSVQLLGYQTAGSSGRPLPNWILMKTGEIVDLEILDQRFPGGRATATGKHIRWDNLFIRVRPAGERTQTGSA